MKFFISYSHVDKDLHARPLAERLHRAYGHGSVFYDEELLGGDAWWEEILRQIAVCDIFIYLLSNESVSSPYCQAEFAEARRLQKRIITVQVRDKTKLTAELADIQYVDLSAGLADAHNYNELIAAINKQMRSIPDRAPKPLRKTRTPKPSVTDAAPPGDRPDVDTPPLTEPHPHLTEPRAIIRAAWITALITGAAMLVAAILPTILASGRQGSSPPATAELTTALAALVTDAPAETMGQGDASSPTPDAAATVSPFSEDEISSTQALSATPVETDAPDGALSEPTGAERTAISQGIASAEATASASSTSTPVTGATSPSSPPTGQTRGPISSVTRNDDWTPQIEVFDGVEMVLVPPGCFMMGDGKAPNARPVHEVCFDQPFWIDRYEVTNAQFEQFGGQAERESMLTGANHPRENTYWFEAHDFCIRRGARLPTEAEWEYAARGPDSLNYPWGNTFIADNVVYVENSDRQTAEVGSRPGGVSWVGALDLSGNVKEWVSSLFEPYPYQANDGREADARNNPDVLRVVRGGDHSTPGLIVTTHYRTGHPPGGRSVGIGIRCARSY